MQTACPSAMPLTFELARRQDEQAPSWYRIRFYVDKLCDRVLLRHPYCMVRHCASFCAHLKTFLYHFSGISKRFTSLFLLFLSARLYHRYRLVSCDKSHSFLLSALPYHRNRMLRHFTYHTARNGAYWFSFLRIPFEFPSTIPYYINGIACISRHSSFSSFTT